MPCRPVIAFQSPLSQIKGLRRVSKFKARSYAQLEGKGRGRMVKREVERKRGEDRKDGKGRGEERKRKAA